MSGHSKWSSIKHKKGAADAKRGKLFSKLARAITVAARDGGGDTDGNPALATAVQKAREASMPKDKIQKAIDTGTGAGSDGAAIERIVYEGYGPAGVAVMVEALTDNRNRASAEIRHAFSSHGGSLGEPGSVAWIFERKGAVTVDAERFGEDDLMPAIDAGAEDVREEDGKWTVLAAPSDLSAVREALAAAGVEVSPPTIAIEPKSTVELKGHDAERLLKLLDALDDQDDVDEVFANFDIPEQVLEQLAA
ncbi:MAG: YebC/PmpR family DNA-binding transcriptional regulator [Solirubrobacterales bacterium]